MSAYEFEEIEKIKHKDYPLEDFYEEYPVYETEKIEDPRDTRMAILVGVVVTLIILFIIIVPKVSLGNTAVAVESVEDRVASVLANGGGEIVQIDPQTNPALSTHTFSKNQNISPVFSPEVQYWGDNIAIWAKEHNLDPNIVATIMQVESCGNHRVASGAGAQGLFQVMPFHFKNGEDMLDPDTNAKRGLNYYVERLEQTNGDRGLAFAGYNGGHVAAATTYNNWYNETQRYFEWTTGIMADIDAGLTQSPTLERWFAAGGASLCQGAARQLGLSS